MQCVKKMMEERWRRRWAAPQAAQSTRNLRIQEAVLLRHTPEQVWAMILPAEHASVLSPNIARGFAVPGSPDGLGHQQCFTDLDGQTSIIEVIEYEEARRAVTQTISPTPAVPMRMVNELEPVSVGTLFIFRLEIDATTAAIGWTSATIAAQRQRMQDYLDRVRRALAADN
jgi:Polyketide cyclase / dehydrase and lipid transport